MSRKTKRPIYESEADRQAEKEIIKTFLRDDPAGLNADQFFKMIPIYGLDFGIMRDDKVIAFAEVKVRDVKVSAYPSLMLSLDKVMRGKELSETTGKPTYFVVQYQDCFAFLPLNAVPFTVRHGGRDDRNDPMDVEPVCHFSVVDLNLFGVDPLPSKF